MSLGDFSQNEIKRRKSNYPSLFFLSSILNDAEILRVYKPNEGKKARERERARVMNMYVYRLEYIPFGADQDRRRKNCFKHSNRV